MKKIIGEYTVELDYDDVRLRVGKGGLLLHRYEHESESRAIETFNTIVDTLKAVQTYGF